MTIIYFTHAPKHMTSHVIHVALSSGCLRGGSNLKVYISVALLNASETIASLVEGIQFLVRESISRILYNVVGL